MKSVIFKSILLVFIALGVSSCSDNEFDESDQISIETSSLPRASTTMIESYFSGATVTSAKKANAANIYGSIYSALLSSGFEIDFNEQGLWTEIESDKNLAIPTSFLEGELPMIFDYLKSNYAEQSVVELERERNGYSVELNNGIELVFDQEQNLIGIDLDDDDDNVRITLEELPQISRDFMAAHFGGADAITVNKENDDNRISYDVYLNNGVKVEFGQDGNWVEIESKRNQAVPTSILPDRIRQYIAENYAAYVLKEVEKDRNGRYTLELEANRQDIELEFDANGAFIGIDD